MKYDKLALIGGRTFTNSDSN